MATKEFDILALDGPNFLSWAMDLKVNMLTLGFYRCIDESNEESYPSGFENRVHVLGGSTCFMDISEKSI